MKVLTLIRHAKSDWGNEGLQDIDRHLNERGYSDAYLMSKWFAENQKKPELILSSTASRALSTALIFSRSLGLDHESIKLDADIYEATVPILKSVLAAQDEDVSSILMVGHNPGFTNLCNELSADLFFDNLPTCGIVSFQLKGKTWAEALQNKVPVAYHYFPKDYKNKD